MRYDFWEEYLISDRVKIVLYQPEIPQNTGNVGRLCVATETFLYLVKPLGFFLNSREVRRAGLDYWRHLQHEEVDDFETVQKENPQARFWFFSKKATRLYTEITYQKNDILVFGSETNGLPESLLTANSDKIITIPMWGPTRSLNLATAVGIGMYEAYRQIGRNP